MMRAEHSQRTPGFTHTTRAHALAWLLLTVAVLGFAPGRLCAQAATRIGTLVEAASVQGMRWPDFRDYQAIVREFYAATGNAPAWVQGSALTPQALSLIGLFQSAGKKGLDPEDYDASRWDARRQMLARPNADVAAVDVAMTVAAMRYVSDLRIGRVNPKHLDFGLSVEEKKYNLAQFLRQRLVNATDVSGALADIEPPFPGYRRTEAALERYSELAKQDDGEKLPVPAKPLEPGQPYAGLARLTRLLRLVGDLPVAAAGNPTPQVYSAELAEAVKRFQRRHGLDDDGRLGSGTVRELNVPLADRARQLALTLERWRWVPGQFVSPPIVVNIPDFRLRTLDATNSVSMDMRVVVGKAMRTETPVFSRDMTYIVFRPYWVVPPGIMRSQILPGIRRDRDYIAKKGYEVTTGDGKVVTNGTISDEQLAQLEKGRLMVRQPPGPKNALGLVKLMFPNEHHVYLHSTPSTQLFERTRRDFSHGCIRVEKPAELAAWALRNNPGWTLAKVQEAMESGRDDVTVKLAQRIPVFIVYGTALAYVNDEVHFYDDLYGHDRTLIEALAKTHAAP